LLLLCLSLPIGMALAQERAAVAPEPPAQSAPAAPQRQPGFLEAFGRWVDESVVGIGKGIENAWRGAATKSDEAAKASSEASANMAKGAVDAAKGTADALGKIGSARVVAGRERCVLAANGAPDCRLAAETLCKAKGFATGNSIDFETAETCPPQVLLSGRRSGPECRIEHVVTKAMCQ
jgi:hypothetical protein